LSSPRQNSSAASDLTSLLKGLPDWCMRAGIRFPPWTMLLLVAPLVIFRIAEG
jgi:hypothetical protein